MGTPRRRKPPGDSEGAGAAEFPVHDVELEGILDLRE